MKCRAGLVAKRYRDFPNASDEIWFRIYGIDRENLCDLADPTKLFKEPYPVSFDQVVSTGVSAPVVRREISSSSSEGADVADGADVVEEVSLDTQIREAQLEYYKRKTKLVNVQIDIATFDLFERRKKLLTPPTGRFTE